MPVMAPRPPHKCQRWEAQCARKFLLIHEKKTFVAEYQLFGGVAEDELGDKLCNLTLIELLCCDRPDQLRNGQRTFHRFLYEWTCAYL